MKKKEKIKLITVTENLLDWVEEQFVALCVAEGITCEDMKGFRDRITRITDEAFEAFQNEIYPEDKR